MKNKKILIIIAILILVLFVFVFLRPPIAKIYCQRKMDKARMELIKLQEEITASKLQTIQNMTDNGYKRCLHRWGI